MGSSLSGGQKQRVLLARALYKEPKALALVAFVAWGEVNRKARLSGLLVPTQGSLNITAQQSGVLMELPITEGQTVQASDVLLVLNTEHRSLLQGAVGDTSERAALQIEARHKP